MATVQETKDGMIMVRWDVNDWVAGRLPYSSASLSSVTNNFTYGQTGLIGAVAADPYRRIGSIVAGIDPAAATNEDQLNFGIAGYAVNGTTAYLIELSTDIHSYNILTNTISITAPFPKTIAAHGGHSAVVGEDCAIFHLNGTKYLFYSWNDNTDGDIGRYNILASTFDDDYVSTAATSGAVLDKDFPHPMIVGDDGILYIGDGNDLASLQGTTAAGIFNASALDLPIDYVITSFAKTRTHLVIYAHRETTSDAGLEVQSAATAFFWDYVSPSFTYSPDLSGSTVGGGFNVQGQPGCFVSTGSGPQNTRIKMLLASNGEFGEVMSYRGGEVPAKKAVIVQSNNSIVWVNDTTGILRYGAPFAGLPTALHSISSISASGSLSASILAEFIAGSVVVSVPASASTGRLRTLTGATYNSSGTIRTGFVALPSNGRNRWKIEYVRLNVSEKVAGVTVGRRFECYLISDAVMQQFGSGGEISNTPGTHITVYDSSETFGSGIPPTITQLSNIYDKDAYGNDFPSISLSLALELRWATAASGNNTEAVHVDSVEVYLTPHGIEQT